MPAMKSQLHCLHHQGQAQFNQWLLVKGRLNIIIEGWAMKGVTIKLQACQYLILFLGMITLQGIPMKEEEKATCDQLRERNPM
jgi:hypothetical protein